jgi:phosphoribosylaminoimidazole (AIR) synthetase
MGIGLVVVVAATDTGRALEALERSGEHPVPLGRIVAGGHDVRYV